MTTTPATKLQIKHKITGAILFEGDHQSLCDLVQAAVGAGAYLEGAYLEGAHLEGAYLEGTHLEGARLEGAYLEGAHLRGAYLEGAHLEGAYLEGARLEGARLEGTHLEGAHLEGAYLEGAHLGGAYLEGAHLEGAYLEGAYLEGAHLEGAYLEGAHLRGAYLEGAHLEGAKNLESARLDTGESFAEYKSVVVPALLTAGGKTLEEVVASGCWDCHQWTNCPMAFAFSVNDLSEIPLLYRPRAKQFVQLFDAKLIPKPITSEDATCPTTPI